MIGDPYIPTPPGLVRAKLEFAEITGEDMVFDLGCGDARVLILAAEEYDAEGVGAELQPSVAELAWSNVSDHQLEEQVEIRCEDYFETDLSEADLVVLYLTGRSLHAISEKLEEELKPGSRVVTHDFHLSGWEFSEQGEWESPEGEPVKLFLYRR